MALGRVYCFGPTFRAEKSKTRRHLTEFWMVEPEMAYADLDDVMELAEDLVVSVVARVLDRRRRELTVLERDTLAGSKRCRRRSRASPTTRRRRRCRARGCRSSGAATSAGRTRRRSPRQFDRPVMVHRYPAAVKAFYMKPDPDRPEVALGVDVLAPEGYGEIIGGGAAPRRSRPAAGSASRSTTCRRRPSSGTWTSAATAPCPTAASAWASSASSPGSAAWSTCARRFRIRACSTGCTRSVGVRGA